MCGSKRLLAYKTRSILFEENCFTLIAMTFPVAARGLPLFSRAIGWSKSFHLAPDGSGRGGGGHHVVGSGRL